MTPSRRGLRQRVCIAPIAESAGRKAPLKGELSAEPTERLTIKFPAHPRYCTQNPSAPPLRHAVPACHLPLKGEALAHTSLSARKKTVYRAENSQMGMKKSPMLSHRAWQGMRDSNPRKRSQSPVCYRYTNPLCRKRRYYYSGNGGFVKGYSIKNPARRESRAGYRGEVIRRGFSQAP